MRGTLVTFDGSTFFISDSAGVTTGTEGEPFVPSDARAPTGVSAHICPAS